MNSQSKTSEPGSENPFFDAPLPLVSGHIFIPAQEWPLLKGPRQIGVYIHYPGSGRLEDVNPECGLMLSLHNWGGKAFSGTADPLVLAKRYNVVAIGVDYLQSKDEIPSGSVPYDHGWMQALDVLRALAFVFHGLKARGIVFARDRIFTTGGSGGGNVSLMATKLAPCTFAVVIDICGTKKLTDQVAFSLPGESILKAYYSQDPASPAFLSQDAQEIRFVGNLAHLRLLKSYGCTAKIISVHGTEDTSCPYAHAEELAANMAATGHDFEFIPITPQNVDGTIFTNPGHSLGNRTEIVEKVAGCYLNPTSPDARRISGKTNFETRESITYPTRNGNWLISFEKGFPEGEFVPNAEREAG